MQEMDLAVLTRDLPDRGLREGDIGTIAPVSRGCDSPDAPSSVVDFDPTVSLVRSFGGVNDSLGA